MTVQNFAPDQLLGNTILLTSSREHSVTSPVSIMFSAVRESTMTRFSGMCRYSIALVSRTAICIFQWCCLCIHGQTSCPTTAQLTCMSPFLFGDVVKLYTDLLIFCYFHEPAKKACFLIDKILVT